MLYSMTGFGRGEHSVEDTLFRVEMRSVNHKGLDVRVRLPHELAPLEIPIGRELRERLGRGRVDVQIAVERLGEAPVRLDVERCASVHAQLDALAQRLGMEEPVRMSDVLLAPELWHTRPAPVEAVEMSALKPALDAAVDGLNATRAREGEALTEEMERLRRELCDRLEEARVLAPARVEAYRDRLEERLRELLEGAESEPLEPQRLAYEVALFADRVDVAEEIARLGTHLEVLAQLLGTEHGPGERVGKRLDFFLQEVLREVNTLASKSRDADLTQVAIAMKSALESMREQAANLQ